MRKLLTKLFVGDYKFKALGYFHSIPRAAFVIVPLIVFTALPTIKTDKYPWDTTYGKIGTGLVCTALFYAFIRYNYIKSAKWEDLDDNQKWQLGTGLKQGWNGSLTDSQWEYWEVLNKKYLKKFTK